MRKIINSTYVSLDGVIDYPQNWTFPFHNDEGNRRRHDLLYACDALLMGRRTYEGLSRAWPSRAGTGDFADRMNALPKYVASTTLDRAEWNATVIKDDIPGQVARLKEQPGHDIVQYGFGSLTRTLLEHGLLDEVLLWIHPVLLGARATDELLNKDGFTASMELADTTTLDTGVIIATYHPHGQRRVRG